MALSSGMVERFHQWIGRVVATKTGSSTTAPKGLPPDQTPQNVSPDSEPFALTSEILGTVEPLALGNATPQNPGQQTA